MSRSLTTRRALAAARFTACFVALAAPACGWAQTAPLVTGDATMAAGAFAGAKGVVGVNEAAGLDNAQSNQAAIVTAPNGAVDASVAQSAQARARIPSAQASIADGALSNVSGVAMVNQAAGAANLQRNSVVIGAAAMGVESVSDSELSAASPKQGRVDVSAMAHGERAVRIGNDVLKNASGIAQINQTAGAGNATANSFVLRPPAGTFF
jgi:heat shock protein HslJ